MNTLTIGRSSQCDIIIPNDSVSRVHARISIVGGQYVYEDVSKYGSVVAGQFINGGKITVSPGTEIMLAGKVPLPWNQIYSQLPLQGSRPYENATHAGYQPVRQQGESIGVGWGILSFFIPIAGWILYFVWKDQTPRRASQAATLAWIGFGIGFVLNLLSYCAAFASYY